MCFFYLLSCFFLFFFFTFTPHQLRNFKKICGYFETTAVKPVVAGDNKGHILTKWWPGRFISTRLSISLPTSPPIPQTPIFIPKYCKSFFYPSPPTHCLGDSSKKKRSSSFCTSKSYPLFLQLLSLFPSTYHVTNLLSHFALYLHRLFLLRNSSLTSPFCFGPLSPFPLSPISVRGRRLMISAIILP